MADMELNSWIVISTAQTGTLTADVKCYGTTDYPVYWESEDQNVVKVSSGMGSKITVTGIKAGSADITATTARGDVTAVCKITVKKCPPRAALRLRQLHTTR
ncbi:MAG: Ig-like domain-containing protein [Anaerovoracaceae bacterium]